MSEFEGTQDISFVAEHHKYLREQIVLFDQKAIALLVASAAMLGWLTQGGLVGEAAGTLVRHRALILFLTLVALLAGAAASLWCLWPRFHGRGQGGRYSFQDIVTTYKSATDYSLRTAQALAAQGGQARAILEHSFALASICALKAANVRVAVAAVGVGVLGCLYLALRLG